MSYYRAGDYYRGGGYYRAGGILGTIGKAIGSVAKAAFGATPVGAVVNTVAGALSRPASISPVPFAPIPTLSLPAGPGRGRVPEPGVTGVVHRMVPGGSSGQGYYNKKGEWKEGKRPTMNVANAKAVRRAGRRMEGFLRLAKNVERQLPHRTVHKAAGGKRCGCK